MVVRLRLHFRGTQARGASASAQFNLEFTLRLNASKSRWRGRDNDDAERRGTLSANCAFSLAIVKEQCSTANFLERR
jgi:hypothetical protein